MAKPTKLTPTMHDAIVRDVARGLPLRAIAAGQGISYSTLRDWLKRGSEEPDGIYQRLFRACRSAGMRPMRRWVQRLEKASREGDTATTRWLLERRYPEHWSRVQSGAHPDAPAGLPNPAEAKAFLASLIQAPVASLPPDFAHLAQSQDEEGPRGERGAALSIGEAGGTEAVRAPVSSETPVSSGSPVSSGGWDDADAAEDADWWPTGGD